MNDKMNTVIILAAGKGTRMNSDIPKVLHTLNDKTLLEHVIDAAKRLNPKQIIVVVGYKKNLVIEKFKSKDLIPLSNKSEKLLIFDLTGFPVNTILFFGKYFSKFS